MQAQGIVPTILPVHILAGALALVFGYVALFAAKGATLHRKSGMLFVYVMSTMALTGMLISAVEGVAPAINIPSALLTFYLVITSLLTVKPVAGSRWLDTAGMLMAMSIGLGCALLGVAAIVRGGREAGMAYPLFLFAGVSILAGVGDRRVIRAGGIRGVPRLRRHLWRMCFALFVASIAFFLGPDRLPEMLRSPVFRASGVLLPIAAMSYWMWRIRTRNTLRTTHVPAAVANASADRRSLGGGWSARASS
jgi:uncharacterized membrane protein